MHERDAGSEAGRPRWLVPVAIGGVAALALVAGVMLAIVLGGRDGEIAEGSASPSASASVVPSAAESASLEPSPSIDEAPVLENREVAEVVGDRLNVRTGPGSDSDIRFTLDPGRRVFIIGSPQEADDLRWYRVGVVGTRDCLENCTGIGWVATPLSGEQWLELAVVDCPASPMEASDVSGLASLEMLHCYGRQQIEISGLVDTPCCGYVGPFRFRPTWLALPTPAAFLRDALLRDAGVIGFRTDPSVDLDIPERGDIVRVRGHFEDPTAADCRIRLDPDFGADVEIGQFDQAEIVLTCRATFVWDEYEVTGHEDLGPCCGSRRPAPAATEPWAATLRPSSEHGGLQTDGHRRRESREH